MLSVVVGVGVGVLDLVDNTSEDAVVRIRRVRGSLNVVHEQVMRELVDPLGFQCDLGSPARMNAKDAAEGEARRTPDDWDLECAVVDVRKCDVGMAGVVVLGAMRATRRIDELIEERRIQDKEAELGVRLRVLVVDEADTEVIEGLLDGVAEEKAIASAVEVGDGVEIKVRVQILSVRCVGPDVGRRAPVATHWLVEDHATKVVRALNSAVVVGNKRVLEVGALGRRARWARPGELVPRQQTLHDLHHASHQPGVLAI